MIKRYSLDLETIAFRAMGRSDDGDYVIFSDHEAEVERRVKEARELALDDVLERCNTSLAANFADPVTTVVLNNLINAITQGRREMTEPNLKAITDWNRQAQADKEYQDRLEVQKDIERNSFNICDIHESLSYLTELERKILIKAYLEEDVSEIGFYHGLARNRYVKFFAEQNVNRGEI